MRFVSSLAMSVALGVAGIAVAAMPAAAVAKEKKAEAPKRNFSKDFIPAAQEMEKAQKAKDFAALKAAVDAGAAKASNADDQYLVNFYKLQAGLGLQDVALQQAGIDGMLATGTVVGEDLPRFQFYSGKFAFDAKEYDKAIDGLTKAIQSGYTSGDAELLIAESYFSKGAGMAGGQVNAQVRPILLQGLPHLRKAIDQTKAAGTEVPVGWYRRGYDMARATNSPETLAWATDLIHVQPSPAAWNNLVRSYQQAHTDLTRSENIDLMRLLLQAGALQQSYDYSEYVDAVSKSGLPGEVKAVVENGRAKGILNATQLNDYYTQAVSEVKGDQAALAAGEAGAAKAATAKPAVSTGDAYLGYAKYADAVKMYDIGLGKTGADVAEVTTRKGIALALSGDYAGAKAAFEGVTTGNRAEIAKLWLLWISTKTAA